MTFHKTWHIERSARLSECGRYRYLLIRRWGNGDSVLFVMLNPSTADDTADDPTIRRCIGFARSWGYDGIRVVNLFALRATQPTDLYAADDPIGPENYDYVRQHSRATGLIIAAWGAHSLAKDGARHLIDRDVLPRQRMQCLGVTKDGSPRHPLYIRTDTQPQPWQLAARGNHA